MGWTNIEIESVEVVQDMSYAKIKEQLEIKIEHAGVQILGDELEKIFILAARAVADKQDDFRECVLQGDASFKIIMSTYFILLELLKEKCTLRKLTSDGLDMMFHIRCMEGEDIYEKFRKNIRIFQGYVDEEIKRLRYFTTKKTIMSSTTLENLRKNRNGKDVFEIYSESVLNLIDVVCNSITMNGYCVDKNKMGVHMSNIIYKYAENVFHEECHQQQDDISFWDCVDDLFRTIAFEKNKEMLQSPFSYYIKKFVV